MTSRDVLNVWTIYLLSPRRPPVAIRYLAKRFEVHQGGRQVSTNDYRVGPTLEAVRQNIPQGLHRHVRQAEDSIDIVESWL